MAFKVQRWGMMAVAMLTGCYQAHGVPGEPGEPEPELVSVSVMAQTGGLPPVPAPGARVVVEDCTTGELMDAVTGDDGLAEFELGESTCWNVTAVIDGSARSVLGAPVPLPGPIVFPLAVPPPTDDGGFVIDPPGAGPPRNASVEVLLRVGGVYNMVNPHYHMEGHVYVTSPSGAARRVGPNRDHTNTDSTSPAGLVVRADYTWTEDPNAEPWMYPMAGGQSGYFDLLPACSIRRVTWGRVRVVDGVTHRTEIPPVTTRQVSGTSLDTLVIDFGGAGHRSFVALRVAGDDGFEWTIEPFQTGVAHFEGLPALPEGVAESVGLRERSVYVRFGATAPTAAQFDPTDVSQRTVPWLIHEGFVIGQVSDFEPGLAECEQVP